MTLPLTPTLSPQAGRGSKSSFARNDEFITLNLPLDELLMAALVLSVAGGAAGAVFGPAGAIAGRIAGALVGNFIDRSLFAQDSSRSVQGPRLADLDAMA